MNKTSVIRILAIITLLGMMIALFCGCSLKPMKTEHLDGVIYCYAEPDINSEIVKTFNNGLQISYAEDAVVGDLRWVETDYGWIHLLPAEEVFDETVLDVELIVFTTASVEYLYAGPGTDFEQSAQLPAGTRVSIIALSQRPDGQWGKTEEGWIFMSNVYTPGVKGANTGFGVVRESGAPVYDRIYEYGAAISQLNTGDRVEVLEIIKTNMGEWAYTEGGWVNLTGLYIEGRKGNRPCTGMVIDSTPLNVRMGPSTDCSINTSLPYGTYVNVLERINCNGNDWGFVGNGWIFMNLVDID